MQQRASSPMKGVRARQPAAPPPPAAAPARPVDKMTVYVSNLPYEISDTFVIDAFWQGAQIEIVKAEVLTMGMPHGHKKTCGLALVKLKSEADALLALEKMDGYRVLNRPMIVRADKFMEDDPLYEHGKEPTTPGAAKVPVR